MEHDHGAHHGAESLNRVAFSATVHCLTGCAIGEVLGMIIGTALGWNDWQTIALAVVLAFCFGYSFTLVPLLRGGLALGAALPIAFAADTISITIMEIVDNAIMLLIPGAMGAGLTNLLFWASLAFALVVAGAVAYPVNRWLIARGRGHAVVHAHH
jgi:formate/nitrite transporter FocA (FNT family)